MNVSCKDVVFKRAENGKEEKARVKLCAGCSPSP